MAYIKTVFSTGDTITATLANHWETQYDEALADANAYTDANAAPISHVGSGGTAHALATTTVDGFIAAADKTKLNGIEAGATADQTAGEILTAVKTVDGAGSGLDADLLKGSENYVQTRITSGQLEYLDGGTWKPVAAIKSVQRGIASISLSDETINVSISSVNMSKTKIYVSYTGWTAEDVMRTVRGQLTSATNLEFYSRFISNAQGSGAYISWEVIEYA